jgi:hypothetical protein
MSGKLRGWKVQCKAVMVTPPEKGQWCARVSPDACGPWTGWSCVPGRGAQAQVPTPEGSPLAGCKRFCAGPPGHGECHTWCMGE